MRDAVERPGACVRDVDHPVDPGALLGQPLPTGVAVRREQGGDTRAGLRVRGEHVGDVGGEVGLRFPASSRRSSRSIKRPSL